MRVSFILTLLVIGFIFGNVFSLEIQTDAEINTARMLDENEISDVEMLGDEIDAMSKRVDKTLHKFKRHIVSHHQTQAHTQSHLPQEPKQQQTSPKVASSSRSLIDTRVQQKANLNALNKLRRAKLALQNGDTASTYDSIPFIDLRWETCTTTLSNLRLLNVINFFTLSKLVNVIKGIIIAPFKAVGHIVGAVMNDVQNDKSVGDTFLTLVVTALDESLKALVGTILPDDVAEIGAIFVGVVMAVVNQISESQLGSIVCLVYSPNIMWNTTFTSPTRLEKLEITKEEWASRVLIAEHRNHPSIMELKGSFARTILSKAVIKLISVAGNLKAFLDGPFSKIKAEVKSSILEDSDALQDMTTFVSDMKLIEISQADRAENVTKQIKEKTLTKDPLNDWRIFTMFKQFLSHKEPESQRSAHLFWCYGDSPLKTTTDGDASAHSDLKSFHSEIYNAYKFDDANCQALPRQWCPAPPTAKTAKSNAVDHYDKWKKSSESDAIGLLGCETIPYENACNYSMDEVRFYIEETGKLDRKRSNWEKWVTANDITPGFSFPCDARHKNMPPTTCSLPTALKKAATVTFSGFRDKLGTSRDF